MTHILLRSVHIIDPRSPFHDQIVDVHIQKGKFVAIGKNLNIKEVKEIDAQKYILMPGLFDLNCTIGEPGFETKETLKSASKAAAAGGFTGITCLPCTQPILQSSTQIHYISNASKDNLVDIIPIGALSEDLKGNELTEMYDMQRAGAKAFSNGNKAISNDGLMYRALLYAKGIDALLMSFPENTNISENFPLQESEISTLLGMKGAPTISEEMQIARDIYLAQHHQYKIHISSISTVGSVALIKQAKKNGLQITCDVALHNLSYTEKDLMDFDSNYKFKPVLRSKSDVKALIAALKEGTIDAIVTQHTPHEIEFKNVEFQVAKTGSIALQTALAQLLKLGLPTSLIVEKMAIAPREILKITPPTIAENEIANCFLFSAEEEWILNDESNQSLSKNTPQYHKKQQGKVIFTCNKNQIIYTK